MEEMCVAVFLNDSPGGERRHPLNRVSGIAEEWIRPMGLQVIQKALLRCPRPTRQGVE